MKILISGIEGYIGSVLRLYLQKKGHSVTGIDTGFYQHPSDRKSKTDSIYEDIRDTPTSRFSGYDAVVHLADLSNDPLGMIDEKVTREINFEGALIFAKKAKEAGVSRYVYSSSCSVYGYHDETEATETSPTSPQTMYAQCKLDVERELVKLCDASFTPVILRNATVYGMSPSMRFDLVINKMIADAYLFGEIVVNNGGNQWRPLTHILDVCQAIACALEAPREAVQNEIFNVGASDGNCRIAHLAELVHAEFPESRLTHGHMALADKRSYKVSFDKIRNHLPGFHAQYSIQRGIHELGEELKKIGITKHYYQDPKKTRMKQILKLLKSGELDRKYRWTNRRDITHTL